MKHSQILHYSKRHIDSPYRSKNGCFLVNIVFRADSETIFTKFQNQNEYIKVLGRKNPNDKYTLTIFYQYKDFVDPLYSFIQYIPKFNVYRFNEYFVNEPYTRGIFETIETMMTQDENDEYAYDENDLYRLLSMLTFCWD